MNEVHDFRISDVSIEKVRYKALDALRVSMSSDSYQLRSVGRLSELRLAISVSPSSDA